MNPTTTDVIIRTITVTTDTDRHNDIVTAIVLGLFVMFIAVMFVTTKIVDAARDRQAARRMNNAEGNLD